MATQKERFEFAFASLRRLGITPTTVFDDRAMVVEEYHQEFQDAAARAGTPGSWTGTAHSGHRWVGGVLTLDGACGWREQAERLLFYWPTERPAIARTVVLAFRAEGFDARWDGSPHEWVEVWLT